MVTIIRAAMRSTIFTQPSRLLRTLEAGVFFYSLVMSGAFGWIAHVFGRISIEHPHDPHVVAGLCVAGACRVLAKMARAISKECLSNLTRPAKP